MPPLLVSALREECCGVWYSAKAAGDMKFFLETGRCIEKYDC